MRLNASSPIPLYRQLADRLRSEIDAGVYTIDSKIPSENDLADQFRIGRPTVRQATDLLVRQGQLERRRGSGTFVKKAEPAIDVLSLAGTSAAFSNSELNAQLELLSGATLESNGHYCVKRRALVDDIPVLLETLHFHAELFPGLDQQSLTDRSLSALVKEVYFLEPISADQTFSVLMADAHYANVLDLPEQTPLLHVHRRLHFHDNPDALHADIVCRTDRFEFSQTLYPTHANSHASSKAGQQTQPLQLKPL